jgi:parvulin-like peptidyl-prolyl isomerase
MRQSDLNPEIGAIAFSQPVGSFNLVPIRRAGGWFIVRTEDRRSRPTPPYAAMRNQLLETLVREAVPATVQRLVADVSVRKYDITGKERDALNARVRER